MINRVVRTKTVEGIATPAFIHNGSYFLINLPVFADGLVDCWEMVDLALLRDRLRSGWVVPDVPNNETVSVHGLGEWTTSGGNWGLDSDGLYQRVVGLVRQLNPRMENLYDCHGRTTELIQGVQRSILGTAREQPFRLSDPESVFPKRIPGARISVLVRTEEYFIADLRVFADGVIELANLGASETFTFEALEQAAAAGRFASSVPSGARIVIHGLGSFAVAEEHYCTDPRDQIREVSDLLSSLNGLPDSLDRCRAEYASYIENPTVARRDALRTAYESVPEHNRMYVGDMDTKDIPVRMIIYGEGEIERWTHRAVARAANLDPLPSITVPKPSDE